MYKVIKCNSNQYPSFDSISDTLMNQFNWFGRGVDSLENFCHGRSDPDSIIIGLLNCFWEDAGELDESHKDTICDICEVIYGDSHINEVEYHFDEFLDEHMSEDY